MYRMFFEAEFIDFKISLDPTRCFMQMALKGVCMKET